MKNNKGITLIALVITIIVLIILAGISINLLMGDNGIITKAQDAARVQKEGEIKEELSLALTTLKMKNWTDNSLDDSITKQKINQCLSNGSVLQEPVTGNDGYILKYKENDTVYTVNVGNNGKIDILDTDNSGILKISAAEVKASPKTYYGCTVKYEVNDTTDWKILYSDGTHIFLIKSDYLLNTKFPTAVYLSQNETYNGWWPSITNVVTERQDELFMATGSMVNNTLPNLKVVSRLQGTALWRDFVNTTYADYAIGGASIEMYIASWNDMYPNDKLECTPNASAPDQTTGGYKVCVEGGTPANYIATDVMNVKEGFNNTLYYPHPDITDTGYYGSKGYWLSSPNNAVGNYRIFVIGCTGIIASCDFNELSHGYAVRPVVALKADARLTDGTNGYDYNLILK